VINSAETINTLMEALEDSVDYAVLHREEDLANGLLTSDVDVVSGLPALQTIGRLTESAAALALVSFYEYDHGAVSSFWVSRDDLSIAQLDVLHDTAGHGHYGLRTSEALRSAQVGVRWRVVCPEARNAYLWSKGVHKGDRRALVAADPADLRYLSAWRTSELYGDHSSAWAHQVGRRRREIARRIRRLRTPIGFRARIADSSARHQLATALQGHLPTVVAADRALPLATATQLAWRPSLLIVGDVRLPVHADLGEIGSARAMWSAMSDRTLNLLFEARRVPTHPNGT
jgi:hypothetical protein